ncbi:hypothetical protein CDD81_1113 [Ophiocordyceps australis]|uniref:Elongator complex protein 4 n=1 Tax=Ophiocordyceps australis TaxID=1399860 RepID=A0A2C5XZI1_9HYPO|nr:hypothetical protein CDD81_1113 [Ophiocordyceps australis]
MSFRKRNTVIRAAGSQRDSDKPSSAISHVLMSAGVRPSPLDGRPTTSTGTASLDQLLAGHAGLPLASSLLLQENGTSDFSGAVLRYYAAEGLVQGHTIHVLGTDELLWRRQLPGLAKLSTAESSSRISVPPEKMRIAWRYEALGGANKSASLPLGYMSAETFCHSFDMSKHLDAATARGQVEFTNCTTHAGGVPFGSFLDRLASVMQKSSPSSIHRVVVPGLLSPALYNSAACQPQNVLQFLHGLRYLLRKFSNQATAMLTLPLSLYPRSSGLTRWMELLVDGVMELVPLNHRSLVPTGEADAKTQGLLRIHSYPVFHEKGGGLQDALFCQDLAFSLSALDGIVIAPLSLPPLGSDDTAAKSSSEVLEETAQKKKLEF